MITPVINPPGALATHDHSSGAQGGTGPIPAASLAAIPQSGVTGLVTDLAAKQAALSGLAHCRLTLTSDEPTDTGVVEELVWDAASPNVGSLWVSGTNVTIATTGFYLLVFQVTYGTVSQIGALIRKGGVNLTQTIQYDNSQFTNSQCFSVWVGNLTAADVITFGAYAAGTTPSCKDTEEGGTWALVMRLQ